MCSEQKPMSHYIITTREAYGTACGKRALCLDTEITCQGARQAVARSSFHSPKVHILDLTLSKLGALTSARIWYPSVRKRSSPDSGLGEECHHPHGHVVEVQDLQASARSRATSSVVQPYQQPKHLSSILGWPVPRSFKA